MLNLAVFVIAILTTPCFVRAVYELDYIAGDPHIWSHYGYSDTCSYSAATWLQTFFSNRINIESVFSDLIIGQQHPTIQTSFRITFTRPGSPVLTETYVAPDPSLGFSNTFISGASSTGWVDIVFASSNVLIIADYTTGSIIVSITYGTLFDLYLIAPSWFVTRGRGLLVQGCPYKDVYTYAWPNPWQSYNANPNWGRKKRAAEDKIRPAPEDNPQCNEIAAIFAKNFPQYKSLSQDVVKRMCTIDAQFIKDTPDQMKNKIDALQQAEEIRRKVFPDGYEPEAIKDYDNPKITADIKRG